MAAISVCLLAPVAAMEVARGQSVPSSLVVAPARLSFGEQAVGSQSQPAAITVTNPMNKTIKFREVLLSGIDFAENTDCGEALAPGAQCAIQVVFTPLVSGERIGSVTIAASEPGSPHIVGLIGIGK